MTNDYNVGFKEENGYTKVYLEPKCKFESHRKQLGYIDDYTFKCTDNELMTLEVMEGIVNCWKVHIEELQKIPL